LELLNLEEYGINSPRLVEHGVVRRETLGPDDWAVLLPTKGSKAPVVLKACSEKSFRAVDHENRSFPFVASTKTVDRDGDVIVPEAFKARLSLYKKNPVMPWCHNYWFPAVARASDFVFTDDTFEATANFGRTPFALEVFSLYEDGVMNAFSAGWITIALDKDPILDGQDGWTFTKVEILEISPVVVPSNRLALAKSSIHIRGLTKALKEIPGDHVRTYDRQRIVAAQFGLRELDGKSFVFYPAKDFLIPVASAKRQVKQPVAQPVRKEGRAKMFKVYAVPKSAEQAISNLCSTHGVQLESAEGVDALLTELVSVVRSFNEAPKPEEQKKADVLLATKGLSEAIGTMSAACSKVLTLISGEETANAEISTPEAPKPEPVKAVIAPVVTSEPAPATPVVKAQLTEAEKEGLLTSARKRLSAVAADDTMDPERKNEEALRVRGVLSKAGISLNGRPLAAAA